MRFGRRASESDDGSLGELERTIEALLFLSPEPVSAQALSEACEVEVEDVALAIERLRSALESADRGVVLRELGGGYVFSSHPSAEEAARRLLARPRTPPLT